MHKDVLHQAHLITAHTLQNPQDVSQFLKQKSTGLSNSNGFSFIYPLLYREILFNEILKSRRSKLIVYQRLQFNDVISMVQIYVILIVV